MLFPSFLPLPFYLNSAIDTGRCNDISFEVVASHIEAGTIFNFLQKRLSGDIDLSIFDNEKQRELIAEWQDILGAGNASRKFGVQKSGSCLLVAYLLEGVQRRQDSNPER